MKVNDFHYFRYIFLNGPAAGAQKIILQKLEKISTYRKKNNFLHILSEKCMGDSEWFEKLFDPHPWPTKHILTFFLSQSMKKSKFTCCPMYRKFTRTLCDVPNIHI